MRPEKMKKPWLGGLGLKMQPQPVSGQQAGPAPSHAVPVDLTSGYLLPPNGLDAAAWAVHSRVRGHHRLLTGCLRCAGNTGATAPEGRFPKDDR